MSYNYPDNNDPPLFFHAHPKYLIFFDEFDKVLNEGYYNQRFQQELMAYLEETESAHQRN